MTGFANVLRLLGGWWGSARGILRPEVGKLTRIIEKTRINVIAEQHLTSMKNSTVTHWGSMVTFCTPTVFA